MVIKTGPGIKFLGFFRFYTTIRSPKNFYFLVSPFHDSKILCIPIVNILILQTLPSTLLTFVLPI
jgi:hypothetical protein